MHTKHAHLFAQFVNAHAHDGQIMAIIEQDKV